MLEYFVRPFTSPNSQGKIVIPSTPVGTHERATITWGGSGTIPPVQVQSGGSFNTAGCCSDAVTEETDQQYDDVSVTNAGSGDDAGQTINFRRARQFSYTKKEQSACASAWDQFSGVGLEITDALAEFADNITAGFGGQDVTSQSCRGTMSLSSGA